MANNVRVLSFAVGLVAFAFLGCHKRTSYSEMKALIDHELPVGSSPERALALLDSMHAERSDYGPNHIITANLGQSYSKGPVNGNVYVVLHYDAQNRLTKAETNEVLTGP
jgi:hypothetical protein